jgi:YegS/Rv2252/BmrU family lipid kinase
LQTSALPVLPALLVYNPTAGPSDLAPEQLLTILTALQRWNIRTEVHIIEQQRAHERPLEPVLRAALEREIPLVIAAGGDGTIASVAGLMASSRSILGILPTGTKNNIALSLGIPLELHAAAAALREGHTAHVDMGIVRCGSVQRTFLEICSVGLLSALFPAADDVQKGNLARVGDLLATLVSSPPAQIRLSIDSGQTVLVPGHIVLVGNMPYTGPNTQIAPENAYDDGFLDVLVFSSLSKLELLGAALQTAIGAPEDPRILRYSARQVAIETTPPLPVVADGVAVGQGPLTIDILPSALQVMLPGVFGG